MKRIALTIWLLLASSCFAQFQARTDFVPQRAVRVTKTTGAVRAFPPTAAGLDSAVDALAAGDTLETWGSYTLTDDLEFDVRATWDAHGTTITRAGDVVTVTADNVTFRDLRTDGRVVISNAENFSSYGCDYDGSAQDSAVRLESLAHFAKFFGGTMREGTRCLYAIQVNGTEMFGVHVSEGTQDGLYFDYDGTANAGYRGCGAAGQPDNSGQAYYDVDAKKKHRPPKIVGCTIHNNGRYGAYFRWTHDFVFMSNSVEHNFNIGLYVLAPIQSNITGNQFERNSWGHATAAVESATNCEVAIDLDLANSEFIVSQFKIVGNDFGNYMHGVILFGTQAAAYEALIADNNFAGAVGNASTPSRAIWWKTWKASYLSLIANNTLCGQGGTIANQIGIDISAASLIAADNLTIQGNKNTSYSHGILLTLLDGAEASRNTCRLSTYGIRNTSSTNTVVNGNRLSGNVTNDFLSDGTTPTYFSFGNTGLTDNVLAADAVKLAGVTPSAFALTTLDDTTAAAFRTTIGAGRSVIHLGNLTAAVVTDGQTVYFAQPNIGYNTTSTLRRYYLPYACRVTKAYIVTSQAAGSAETASVYVTKNGSTDTLISSAVTFDATNTNFSNTSMSADFAAGDYVGIKVVQPTWATNPTSVTVNVTLEIEAL